MNIVDQFKRWFRLTTSGEPNGADTVSANTGDRSVLSQGDAANIITGDNNQIIMVAERTAAALLKGITFQREIDLQTCARQYLVHLITLYRFLDFKGMGVTESVALRLPLLDMYVPLKARIELPEGETAARERMLAGGTITPEETHAAGARLSAAGATMRMRTGPISRKAASAPPAPWAAFPMARALMGVKR